MNTEVVAQFLGGPRSHVNISTLQTEQFSFNISKEKPGIYTAYKHKREI